MSLEDRLRATLGLGDLTCTLCDRRAAEPLSGPWPYRFGAETFVGTARTVRADVGELAPIDRALDDLEEGGVLLIASGSGTAIWGGRLTARALERKAAGVVVDGCVRDVADLRRAGLPVAARGIAPHRSDAKGHGGVDVDLAFGAVTVRTGDVLVADANGVVVIPRETVEDVTSRLESWIG